MLNQFMIYGMNVIAPYFIKLSRNHKFIEISIDCRVDLLTSWHHVRFQWIAACFSRFITKTEMVIIAC